MWVWNRHTLHIEEISVNHSKKRGTNRSFHGHKLLPYPCAHPFTMSHCCSSHPEMEYYCMLSNRGLSGTHSYQYKWCKQSTVTSEGQPFKSLPTWNAALWCHWRKVSVVFYKMPDHVENWGTPLISNTSRQTCEWNPLVVLARALAEWIWTVIPG